MNSLDGILCVAQDGCCFYCGVRFTGPRRTKKSKRRDDQWTRDHVLPKSKGGDETDNLVLACYGCNAGKGGRLPTREELLRACMIYERINPLREAMLGTDWRKNVIYSTAGAESPSQLSCALEHLQQRAAS